MNELQHLHKSEHLPGGALDCAQLPPKHRSPVSPSGFVLAALLAVTVSLLSLAFVFYLSHRELPTPQILPPASAPVGVTGSLQFRSANHRAVRGPGARELHIDFDDFIEIAKGNRYTEKQA